MVVVGRPRSGLDVVGEVPAGQVDGVNRSFQTTFNIRAGTVRLFLNGVRLAAADFVANANAVILTSAPRAGDELTLDYSR